MGLDPISQPWGVRGPQNGVNGSSEASQREREREREGERERKRETEIYIYKEGCMCGHD